MTTPGREPDDDGRPRSVAGTVVVALRRLALIASQGALALPFVLVEDCNGAEPVTATGVKIIFEQEEGWMLALPLLVAAVLLVTSFLRPSPRPGWRALSASTRALFTAAAGLAAGMLPFLFWLFDTVRPQAGWYLAAVCWGLLYLEGLAAAALALHAARAPKVPDLWDPVCRALRWIVLVIPWPVALLIEPDLDEALLGAGVVMAAVCVPVWLMLTACVAGMRHREPWAAGLAPAVAALVSLAMALASVGAGMQ